MCKKFQFYLYFNVPLSCKINQIETFWELIKRDVRNNVLETDRKGLIKNLIVKIISLNENDLAIANEKFYKELSKVLSSHKMWLS